MEENMGNSKSSDTVTVREPSSTGARAEGDVVRLSADPDEVHLFSPDTTERLN